MVAKGDLVDIRHRYIEEDRTVVREGAPGDVSNGADSLGSNASLWCDEEVVNMAKGLAAGECGLKFAIRLTDFA